MTTKRKILMPLAVLAMLALGFAGTKISGWPVASSANLTDAIPATQGGTTTRTITPAQIGAALGISSGLFTSSGAYDFSHGFKVGTVTSWVNSGSDQYTISNDAGGYMLDWIYSAPNVQRIRLFNFTLALGQDGTYGWIGDRNGAFIGWGGGNGNVYYGEGAAGASHYVAILQGDFASVSRGFRAYRSVRVEASATTGSPLALAEGDTSEIVVNTGAGAKVGFTLPTAQAGMSFTFSVVNANGIRVAAPAGVTIRIGASASSTGGHCDSTTVGDSITINAVSSGGSALWLASSLVGSGWSCA